jgi:hypothetical protein
MCACVRVCARVCVCVQLPYQDEIMIKEQENVDKYDLKVTQFL